MTAASFRPHTHTHTRAALLLLLFPNPFLLLCRQRRWSRAPPRPLLRFFFRLTVHWERARRVDRRVVHPADLPVRLVFPEERFPVLHALQNNMSEEGARGEGRRAWSSLEESPRRSCVRCSLKHPVPNARAASTPALPRPTRPRARVSGRRTVCGVGETATLHERVGPAWAVDAAVARDVINVPVDLLSAYEKWRQ